MGKVVTDNKYYAEIAEAIRNRNGGTTKYTPAQMAEAILAISGGDSSLLPEGYTQLNYIESTGTQYIDTGVIPTVNTKIEVDIDFLSANTTFNCVFGVGQTTTNQFVVYRNGSNMVGQVYSTKTYNTSGVTNTGRNKCLLSNSRFEYGTYSATITTESFTYTYPLYLFAMNSVGAATLYAYQKLYSCKIYDGDTLVRDFAPCRNPIGEIGLYDLVNGVFYCNAGTGSFIASLPPVSLPDGYTQVDYIESNGTQYIDTDFIPNQDTRVIVEGVWLTQNANASIFGARESASVKTYTLTWTDSTLTFLSNYNGVGLTFEASEGINFILDKNKNVTTFNDSAVTSTYAQFTCTVSMYLFATNGNGSVMHKGNLKLSKCQIYDNGTLVRDFIPCKNASGVYGLYDKVNSKFYGNAGSGSFTGG